MGELQPLAVGVSQDGHGVGAPLGVLVARLVLAVAESLPERQLLQEHRVRLDLQQPWPLRCSASQGPMSAEASTLMLKQWQGACDLQEQLMSCGASCSVEACTWAPCA